MVRRPTYLNDARLYSAVTFRPFGQKGGTTLRLHYETGKINGSPPSRILPVENLSRFLNQPDLFPALPDVARVSINPVGPSRRGHVLTLDRRRNLRGVCKSSTENGVKRCTLRFA